MTEEFATIEIKHKRTRAVVFRHKGDLVGAKLRGTDFRNAKLNGKDLTGADLSGASLLDADLRAAILFGATLDRADLSGADLAKAILRGATFRGARLCQARLPVVLRGADFTKADLRGVRSRRPDQAKGAEIADCLFDQADLRDTDLRGLKFKGCSFRAADLRGARFRGIVVNRKTAARAGAAVVLLAGGLGLLWPHMSPLGVQAARLNPNLAWFSYGFTVLCSVGPAIFTAGHRLEAVFSACDFTAARYDETTRWPRGFHPPGVESRS